MAKPATRLRVVQLAFAIGLVTLVVRAFQVQIALGDRYRANALASRTEEVELAAPRGTIYDRNGVELAVTRKVFSIDVAPAQLRNRDEDARTIAAELGLSLAVVRRALRKQWARLPGRYDSEQVQKIRHMRGIHPDESLERFYLNPRLARSVLGAPSAPGRPASGIERYLDSLLTGQPGGGVILHDRFGRNVESPARRDAFPIPGHDVYLTIDRELQDIVERALEDALDQIDARSGDAMIMDPRTGELLAVASRARDGAPPNIFASAFEPGSTAKLFTAAGLLRNGRVAARDIEWGERGVYKLGSRIIRDSHVEGWMTLRDVIRRSSSIGMAKFGQRLSPEELYTTLRDFGLGTSTGIEFPSESPGILRRPDWWSGTSAASVAMGYEVAVTMVQLTQAYAAIANDGVLLRPTLIHSVRAPDGTEVYRSVPEPVRRVVDPEVAGRLRSYLRDVVYEGGTGSAAALSSYELGGKTGTARRAGPAGYIPGSYRASFASMFPADDPQLVMVIKLEDPSSMYARYNAVPLTKAVLEQVLATESAPLDFSRMRGQVRAQRAPEPRAGGTVPYIAAWPVASNPAVRGKRTIPEVRKLSVRAAAQRLHEHGLRVRVEGWGDVQRIIPAVGTEIDAGTIVRVIGSAPGSSS